MYKINCEICNFRKSVDSLDGFFIIPGNVVMTKLPTMENNKSVESKSRKLNNKIRCPQCGRTITLKKEIKNDETKSDGHKTSIA